MTGFYSPTGYHSNAFILCHTINRTFLPRIHARLLSVGLQRFDCVAGVWNTGRECRSVVFLSCALRRVKVP